jgi:hypothetical protein
VSRSLLDRADLPALRALLTQQRSAAAIGLIDSGLLQFDVSDPAWEDRDRLFVAGTGVSRSVRARLEAAGANPDDVATFSSSGGDAMALAFGAALASDLDGNAWRPWVALDASACDDGRVWEVVRAAATAGAGALGVVVEGEGAPTLWSACGWRVHEVPPADPVWLLGALDQVGVTGPAVVVVGGDD